MTNALPSKSRRPNPYDFTRPVENVKMFAGRSRILEDITYYLEMAKYTPPKFHSIAILGERGIGKTSTLRVIQEISNKQEFLSVRLSLYEEMVKNEVQFVKQLFDSLMDAGLSIGAFNGGASSIYKAYKQATGLLRTDTEKYGLPEVPFRFVSSYIGYRLNNVRMDISEPDLRHDLSCFFKEVENHGVSGVVLLVDECDLFTINRNLFQVLRNVLQDPSLQGYISIFAGTPKMFTVVAETSSPILRQFIRIYLTELNRKEAEDCILNPLQESERTFFDYSSIEEIFRLTDGRPYEIQLICHIMYRRFERLRLPNITLSHHVLDEVLVQLEEERRSGSQNIDTIKSLERRDISDLALILQYEGWTVNQIARFQIGREILKESEAIDDVIEQRITHREEELKSAINSLGRKGIIALDDQEKVFSEGDRFEKLYLKYFAESQKVSWDPPSPSYHLAAIELCQEILIGTGLDRGYIRRLSTFERAEKLEEFVSRWMDQLNDGTLLLDTSDPEIFVIEERDFIRSVVYQLRRPDFFANLLRIGGKTVPIIIVKYTFSGVGSTSSFVEFLTPKNDRISKDEAVARFSEAKRNHGGFIKTLGLQVEDSIGREFTIPELPVIAQRAGNKENKELVREVQLAYLYEGREFFREEDVEMSRELFQIAVDMDVSNLDPLYRGIAHNNLGFVLVINNEYEQALKMWHTAVSLYPKTYGNLGMTFQDMSYVYAKLEKWEKALKSCRDAIEADQGRDTRVGWLWVKFSKTKIQPPIHWKWELIESPRVTTSSYCNMVAIYSAKDDIEAAQRTLNKALRLSPNKAYVYRVKGWFELSQSNSTEAIKSFEKAKEFNPNNPLINDEIEIAANMFHGQQILG